jgi:hypothetical protein
MAPSVVRTVYTSKTRNAHSISWSLHLYHTWWEEVKLLHKLHVKLFCVVEALSLLLCSSLLIYSCDLHSWRAGYMAWYPLVLLRKVLKKLEEWLDHDIYAGALGALKCKKSQRYCFCYMVLGFVPNCIANSIFVQSICQLLGLFEVWDVNMAATYFQFLTSQCTCNRPMQ